ncbi:hypothetical protein EI555_001983, partial [Monodon monoceros]
SFRSRSSLEFRPNSTAVTEILFKDFSSFGVIIVTIICLGCHLHTLLYFFLSMLFISGTCYTLVPTFSHCHSRLCHLALECTSYFMSVTNNCFLFMAMQYEHHVAICNPTMGFIGIWVTANWPGHDTVQVTSVFGLPFCDTLVISHFFCDVRYLRELACTDRHHCQLPWHLKAFAFKSQKKAFATCASHLTVITIHYGCASIIYLKPKSQSSLGQDRPISVTYTILTTWWTLSCTT